MDRFGHDHVGRGQQQRAAEQAWVERKVREGPADVAIAREREAGHAVDPHVGRPRYGRLIGMRAGKDMHLPSSCYKVNSQLGKDGACGAGSWGVDAVDE